MKLYEAKKIIKDVFENAFDKEKYTYFVKNLLKNLEIKPFGNGGAYTGNIIPRAFQNTIRKMERIGKYEDEEGNIIDVLVVELNREHSIEHARATQRNFIRWYLNGSRGGEYKDAALVAFYTQKSPDWRFSLIKMQYSLKKGKDEFTPAKRSSFLVGEKGKSHTAQQQLVGLLKNDVPPYLSDLENAFNIEAVSDEFYEKYKTQLFNVKEKLDEILSANPVIKNEFEQKNITTLNFAKKLLGQIVFLYFLQKKGWLGLQQGQTYGEGNRNFMRSLFEQAEAKNKNFFNDYLEYLFYDALSKKRTTDFYEKFGCRIPFLNGGLFDPIHFYNWKEPEFDIPLPNELFSNKTDDNEEGTGILDTFDLYNFTVKEDEPLETEVAIDPEMLGKVFERMLEVKERKSKGAFYTPREIVHYMAQQSLLYYLEAELNETVSYQSLGDPQLKLFGNEAKSGQLEFTLENKKAVIPKNDLETFIHFGEQIIDKDVAIETGKLKESNNKYQLPESIRKNASAIDSALENIKIVDPAVGSGAFPVGVMNEIVKLRNILTPFIEKQEKRTSYYFKANAIENSIYGVDIDAGAVEIAKLRLWLSMVVDESNIHQIDPLPNLEYKIVKGNSLINMPFDSARDVRLEKEIQELINNYYTLTGKKEKQKQKQIIDNKIGKLLQSASQWAGYEIDFDFRLYFHEVFNNKGGFDLVIGNPPFIDHKKLKHISSILKKNFSTYKGTADIYVYFFERGISLLRNKGILSFISSNKWIRSDYGSKLRQFILSKNPLLLIDLGTNRVFDATVDSSIIFIQNDNNHNVFNICTFPKNETIDNFKDFINKNIVIRTDLNEKTWLISNQHLFRIKQKIEKNTVPLNQFNVEFNRGILTGLNEAFIIDEETKNELIKKDKKSAEIIKPLLRGKDIRKYIPKFNNLWLIATFPALYLNIDEYFSIKKYLEQFLPKIKQTGETFVDMNGKKQKTRKKTRNKWFEIQDQIGYFNEFEKEKIIWQAIAKKIEFAYDDKKMYSDVTTFFMTGEKLKYLLAILNSKLFEFALIEIYLEGDTFKSKNKIMQNFPIPKPTMEIENIINEIVNYILFLKKQENDKQSFYFEQIIDGMVYELYFPEAIQQAGCELIKHLEDLPELDNQMSNEEKQKIIDKVFTRLYDKNHLVRKNLYFMDTVEEVKIIKESLEK